MPLKDKIAKSKLVIKNSVKRFNPSKTAIAWTGGKDSTVLLHLVKDMYGGDIPFPVFFNDSTMEFEEIYKFIDEICSSWKLNLITVKHLSQDLESFHTAQKDQQLEISRMMKINALNSALDMYKWEAIMSGIRWDEHTARSKETYVSKRDTHSRIHPILHFTEADIWEYINQFKVPYVELYDKGYRSLGEKPFTEKSTDEGGERSGREQAKEQLMQKIRSLGYW